MNLVEAVNKMLGTDANNLQGALNEAAGTDASNITEAISKIEGGGGGFNPPRVIVGDETGSDFTCDTSYDDFVALISEWGFGLGSIPTLFVNSETNWGIWGTAYKYDGTNYIQITFDSVDVYYLPDGTLTRTQPQ